MVAAVAAPIPGIDAFHWFLFMEFFRVSLLNVDGQANFVLRFPGAIRAKKHGPKYMIKA